MNEELRKIAFMRGAFNAARKFLPAAAGNVAQAFQKATPGVTKGLGQAAWGDAKAGIALGGLLDGGMAAATAAPGERGDAFMQGAARGATIGGLSGAASGVARQGMRNMRQTHLSNVAGKQMAAQGMDPMAAMTYAPQAGETALNRSWFGGMKDAVKGQGATGRAGALFETAAAPATVAADMAVGGLAYEGLDKMLPGGAQPQGQAPRHPQQGTARYPAMPPKTAQDLASQPRVGELPEPEAQPSQIPPIAGSLLGGFAGNRGTEYGLLKLEEGGKLPPAIMKNRFTRGSLPMLAGTTAAALGYGGIKAMQPEQKTPEQQALEQLDLETLKLYFGKQQPQQPLNNSAVL